MVELSLAVKMIRGNRERVFYPVLGIILGVASIVGILALSRGGRTVIENDLSHMGENRVVVVSENSSLRDVDYLETLPFVEYAGAQEMGWRDPGTGITIYATSKAMREAKGIRGNLLPNEILLERDTAVKHRGRTVAVNLQGRQTWLNVAGSYEEKNPMRKRNGEEYGVVDNVTLKPYLEERALSRGITVALKRGEVAEEVAPIIVDALNRFNPVGEYRLVDGAFAHNFVNRIKKSLTGFLMGIGVIAVTLGGFGMSSFMANLINERRGHVGMLKAMGATDGFVFRLFLWETMILASIGGVIGAILGGVLSFILGEAVGIPAVPTGGELVIGFVIAVIMGGGFGILPAKRAGKLNPIDAIRR